MDEEVKVVDSNVDEVLRTNMNAKIYDKATLLQVMCELKSVEADEKSKDAIFTTRKYSELRNQTNENDLTVDSLMGSDSMSRSSK